MLAVPCPLSNDAVLHVSSCRCGRCPRGAMLLPAAAAGPPAAYHSVKRFDVPAWHGLAEHAAAWGGFEGCGMVLSSCTPPAAPHHAPGLPACPVCCSVKRRLSACSRNWRVWLLSGTSCGRPPAQHAQQQQPRSTSASLPRPPAGLCCRGRRQVVGSLQLQPRGSCSLQAARCCGCTLQGGWCVACTAARRRCRRRSSRRRRLLPLLLSSSSSSLERAWCLPLLAPSPSHLSSMMQHPAF